MKIILLNDTEDNCHHGCTATTRAVKARLAKAGELLSSYRVWDAWHAPVFPEVPEDFDDENLFAKWKDAEKNLAANIEAADVVVITGEGTIMGWEGRRATRVLLYLAYIAKIRYNKKVYFINHSCFPVASPYDKVDGDVCKLYAKVYSLADFIAVRDVYSLGILNKLGINATLACDCLPLYVRDHYRPVETGLKGDYVCINGGISFAKKFGEFLDHGLKDYAHHSRRFVFLFSLTGIEQAKDDLELIKQIDAWNRKLKNRLGRYTVEVYRAKNVDEWLSVIRGAKLLVSGRFHHSLAAWSLKVPYVCFASHTLKTTVPNAIMGHEDVHALSERNFLPFETPSFHTS